MSEEKELKWTPAVLGAILRGDFENALIAATPGGIEAQEARGQRDFVRNETLPIDGREQMEALGIEYLEPADDLFWYVKLPEGWKKEPTDHSMWSNLLDDKGRKRAAIFYKAAFYDRSAHITASHRYSWGTQPVGGWDNYDGPYHGVVLDCERVIWETPEKLTKPERPSSEWYDSKDALGRQAWVWLEEHYPDWDSYIAYWD